MPEHALSGRRSTRPALCSLLGAFLLAAPQVACGYAPLYPGGASGSAPEVLHIRLVRTMIADVTAAAEVVAGARVELSRAGVLASGEGGYPAVEIEVLGDAESSEGLVDRGGQPVARALDVMLVARAWIVRTKGAAPIFDTGDLRASDIVAVDVAGAAADPREALFHRRDALRAVGRRLGQALALRLAGDPVANMTDVTDRLDP